MSFKNPFGRTDEFEPKELMVGTGITTEIYNQWLYRHVITASKEADGPGSTSKYSFADIVVVAIIIKLRQVDMRLKRARMLAADIVGELMNWQQKNGGSKDWPIAYLAFTDGGFRVDIGEDRGHETVLRIDLKPVIVEVCCRIENMGVTRKGRPRKKNKNNG